MLRYIAINFTTNPVVTMFDKDLWFVVVSNEMMSQLTSDDQCSSHMIAKTLHEVVLDPITFNFIEV